MTNNRVTSPISQPPSHPGRRFALPRAFESEPLGLAAHEDVGNDKASQARPGPEAKAVSGHRTPKPASPPHPLPLAVQSAIRNPQSAIDSPLPFPP